jgi:plastocyanin
MVDRAYQPRTRNIKVGTEVIWSNASCPGGCTVNFAGLSLDSGPMAIGATFKHTFREAGIFIFHCDLDETEMRGTILVTD